MDIIEKPCCVCLKIEINYNKLTKRDSNDISLLNKFKMSICELQWLSSFYFCTYCTSILEMFYKFKSKCIESDIIRNQKGQNAEEKLLVPNLKQERGDNDITLDSVEGIMKIREDFHVNVQQSSECYQIKRKRNKHFSCQICEKVFFIGTLLVTHCRKDHKLEFKNIKPFSLTFSHYFKMPSKVFYILKFIIYHECIKSNICSYYDKEFVTKTDLLNHEKQHLNMRKYKCELCNKTFKGSHKLMVHTDSSKWKYIWKICTKPFRNKSNYDSHVRRHLGDKKFSCALCQKKFVSKCDLNHLLKLVFKIHLTQVYTVGCIKIPNKNKNYICHFCSKAYYTKNKLSKHLCGAHVAEKLLLCEKH
ncbi:hypothetical protein ABEB36_007297 [Hypothenemus hampei]|uniref:C2H2-type domain-containing protein n=1 Tax=Hypothenemus hampei TaxID=57062 RepID=A0ABD1EU25_HYPHA